MCDPWTTVSTYLVFMSSYNSLKYNDMKAKSFLQQDHYTVCILKGSDDGVMHFEESCFWTLSIVQCF
jgi:hypothetical protein